MNEIVFTYPTMKDVDKDGKSFTYDVTIYADVVADRPIMDVKPYATRPFHNVLEKAFTRFDGSAPFQVTAQDDRTAPSNTRRIMTAIICYTRTPITPVLAILRTRVATPRLEITPIVVS